MGLLCSPGTTQYHIITYNGKESECLYVYIVAAVVQLLGCV